MEMERLPEEGMLDRRLAAGRADAGLLEPLLALLAALPRGAATAPGVDEHGAPFLLLHVESGEAWVRRRMRERAREAAEPSDADFAVHRRRSARFASPRGEPGVLPVSGERDPADTATAALARLCEDAPVPP